VKTGRSPKDKRLVEHPDSKNDIWWGMVNIACDERTFQINRQLARGADEYRESIARDETRRLSGLNHEK
jgi:ATP-dependent phosphoenolpyruvate carboxykinase